MLAEFEQLKAETHKDLGIVPESETATEPTDWSRYHIEINTDISEVIDTLRSKVGEPLLERNRLETQHGRIKFLQSNPRMTFSAGRKAVEQEKARLTEYNEQLEAAINYLEYAPSMAVGYILRSYRSSLADQRFINVGQVVDMLEGKCRSLKDRLKTSPYLRNDTRSEAHIELEALTQAVNALYKFDTAVYEIRRASKKR